MAYFVPNYAHLCSSAPSAVTLLAYVRPGPLYCEIKIGYNKKHQIDNKTESTRIPVQFRVLLNWVSKDFFVGFYKVLQTVAKVSILPDYWLMQPNQQAPCANSWLSFLTRSTSNSPNEAESLAKPISRILASLYTKLDNAITLISGSSAQKQIIEEGRRRSFSRTTCVCRFGIRMTILSEWTSIMGPDQMADRLSVYSTSRL